MSLVESPVTSDVTIDGDHDLFSHVVVPKSAVTKAYILGTVVTALCGKTWVPSRSPERYSVCPECKEIIKGLGHDV